MNVKTKEIYSEVYQVLTLLGNEYIEKLPSSLFNMLKEKRKSKIENSGEGQNRIIQKKGSKFCPNDAMMRRRMHKAH